jgi:hypothetical protein
MAEQDDVAALSSNEHGPDQAVFLEFAERALPPELRSN